MPSEEPDDIPSDIQAPQIRLYPVWACISPAPIGPTGKDTAWRGQDPLNAHIDGACREALVDIMACYLIPRHGARVMELYVSQDQPNDESTLDILKRAVEKKAIPLQRRSGSPRQRQRPAASNKEPALRNRAFLGPRRNPPAGMKLILVPALTWEKRTAVVSSVRALS